jgi:hypothetical protein
MSFYASITNQNESPSRRNAGLEYRLHWNLHRKRHYSCRSIVKRKNSTNININRTLKKRHMALEIQVLAWDRHTHMTGLNRLLFVRNWKSRIYRRDNTGNCIDWLVMVKHVQLNPLFSNSQCITLLQWQKKPTHYLQNREMVTTATS